MYIKTLHVKRWKKYVILVSCHVTSKYWMEDRGYFPNLKKIKCYKQALLIFDAS